VRTWSRRGPDSHLEAKHRPLEAVLTVGTTSVCALVVSRSADRATVWGYGRGAHGSGYGLEGRLVDSDRLAEACEEVLSRAERMTVEAVGRPLIADDVRFGVSGAFLWSHVPAIRRKRAHPSRPVSTEELERILHSLVQNARSYTATLSRRARVRMRMVSLSSATFYLDDRWVTDPRGFRGRELRVRAFAAFAPRIYIDVLYEVAERLEMGVAAVVATPDALAAAMPQADGIIVKVGGTTTQVISVRHRCPQWFDRYDLGGAAFTQRIREETGLLPERAEEAKHHYALGGGDEETRLSWAASLAPLRDQWQEGLIEVLHSAGVEYDLPSTILFCGGGSALPDLFHDLVPRLERRGLPFAHSVEIRRLSVPMIEHLEDRAGGHWEEGDVPAASVAVHAVMAGGRGPLATRLQQICKEYKI